MPQKSKKPSKKANMRASNARVTPKRSPAPLPPKAVIRSGLAEAETKVRPAKTSPGPKPRKPVPSQAKAKGKAKAHPKPNTRTKGAAAQAVGRRALPKPTPGTLLKARAKSKPNQKPPARVSHSLILPPRPKRLAARLLIARAPRAARIEDTPPMSRRSLPRDTTAPTTVTPRRSLPLNATAPATLQSPIAALGPPSVAASTLRVRARAARSRVTLDTWRELEALAARLGRAPLNDEQRVAIRAALEGHDSLVVIADDERAVSCYQLAAFQLTQPTVLVSPVAAELKAQHEALIAHELPVVHLSAELSAPERSAALARISRGSALLILLPPEALHAPDLRHALAKAGIALFVVEEAHCASGFSHELRPSYGELGSVLRTFDTPPVMALTRVATAAVRRDIRERLGLNAPVTIQSPAVRENVQLVTKLPRGEGQKAALVRLVERLSLPGLVFCATPHDVDSVYAALRGAGIAAHRHHSGLCAVDRADELANFGSPRQLSVMVAVSAFAPTSGLPGIGEQAEASAGFGRGPVRRDLRFIVHYQSPASIEQYLREIQRAGGDGLPATCVLLHESSHRSLHEVMLAQLRFRATHLAELGRALETAALEGRTISLEALALGTGQSRRTTARLTALLADAGIVSRAAGWVRVLCTAAELDEACRRLGAQLYALREQDARRLASVSAFAEASECKLSCLSQYLGEGIIADCGRCSACVTELMAPNQESLAPESFARRGAVSEFSVQPVSAPVSRVVPSGEQSKPGSRIAKMADLGVGGTTQRD